MPIPSVRSHRPGVEVSRQMPSHILMILGRQSNCWIRLAGPRDGIYGSLHQLRLQALPNWWPTISQEHCLSASISCSFPRRRCSLAHAHWQRRSCRFLGICSSQAGSISAQRHRPQLCIASSSALTALSVPDLSYQHLMNSTPRWQGSSTGRSSFSSLSRSTATSLKRHWPSSCALPKRFTLSTSMSASVPIAPPSSWLSLRLTTRIGHARRKKGSPSRPHNLLRLRSLQVLSAGHRAMRVRQRGPRTSYKSRARDLWHGNAYLAHLFTT